MGLGVKKLGLPGITWDEVGRGEEATERRSDEGTQVWMWLLGNGLMVVNEWARNVRGWWHTSISLAQRFSAGCDL